MYPYGQIELFLVSQAGSIQLARQYFWQQSGLISGRILADANLQYWFSELLISISVASFWIDFHPPSKEMYFSISS